MSASPFAFGPSAVVCVEGKELLVYDPDDEAPLWKKALAAPIAAVAVAGDHVLALDARGTLVRLAVEGGAEEAKETFIGEPRALAARTAESFAVALEDGVVVVTGESRVTLPIDGARALAFSAKLLAIGTEAGALRIVDGHTTVAEAELGAPIRALVRHPAGVWLAAAKDTVFVVKDDGEATPFTRPTGKSLAGLACAKDGSLVALQTDARVVTVVAYPSKETVGTATYPERDAAGVALTDDGRFLWIGIDKGDANKIDLDEHDVYRTDPHPGRVRAAWVLKVKIDRAARARAKAHKESGATKAAPKPAARATTTEAPAAAAVAEAPMIPSGPPEPEMPPSSAADKRVVLGVLFAAAAIGILSLFVGR